MSLFDARRTAFSILMKVEEHGAYADRELHRARDIPALNEGDYRLLQQLVRGTLQHRAELDALLDPLLSRGLGSLSLAGLTILRMGSFQLRYFDKVPKEVAVNDSVELAKEKGSPALGRLVNAVLRRIVREAGASVSRGSTDEAPLATSLNHPDWMVKRWVARYGIDETTALCNFNNLPPITSLRVNTLRISRDVLAERLKEEGVETTHSPYDEQYLRLNGRTPAISSLRTFQEGLFQIQDESAGLVTRFLGAQPGELVLDLCSAPGGKATHLAELMQGTGSVVACDASIARLRMVRENAARLGHTTVQCICADGRRAPFLNRFERVLLDAPCSGLGVLSKRVDARWRKTFDDITGVLPLQRALLQAAAALVRPGGTMLYATCSIEPEENEEMVETFLAETPNFRRISMSTLIPASFATAAGDLLSLPQHHGIGGAYAARLHRSN